MKVRSAGLFISSFVYLVVTTALPNPSTGADIFWNNTTGGSHAFSSASNWSPTQVPGATDQSIFDNPGALPFTVTFSADVTNNGLRINDDDVIFDLGGNTYRVVGTGIRIGQLSGDDGVLTTTNGTLSGDLMTIGALGGNGNVEVTTDGILDIDFTLGIGDDDGNGTGVFSVENNAQVHVGTLVSLQQGSTYIQNGGQVTTGSFFIDDLDDFFFNDGTLTVHGALPSFPTGEFSPATGPFEINGVDGGDPGADGPTLRLENGATASFDEFLNIGTTDAGEMVITGSQSLVSVGRFVELGTLGGTGTLLVEDRAGLVINRNTAPDGDLTLGRNGGSGHVTVDGKGNGAAISVADAIAVGQDAAATASTLDLIDGGAITTGIDGSGAVLIGQESGSNGVVTVTGTNSVLDVGGNLSLGGNATTDKNGTGTLTVSNGGRLKVADALIVHPGASAVHLTGAASSITTGSLIDHNEDFDANWNGGTLTITNQIVHFGSSINQSFGELLDVGTDEKLHANLNVIVADNSNGELRATGGGMVSTNADIVVGNASGTIGTVRVEDSGSSMSAGGRLRIGDEGQGVMTIRSSSTASSTGDTNIAQESGSSGSLSVENDDSSLNVGGSLFVGGSSSGAGGSGILTVNDGGSVDVDSTLRIYAGSSVSLQDAASSITTAALIDENGDFDANWNGGSLTITNQPVNIGSSVNAPFGPELNVQADEKLQVNQNVIVGNSMPGTLNVVGGDVFVGDDVLTFSDLVLGNNSQGDGLVQVIGLGSSLTAQKLRVGDDGLGVFSVRSGASVSSSSDTNIGQESGSSGTLSVEDAGSSLIVGGSLFVGGSSSGEGGNATLNVGVLAGPSDGTDGFVDVTNTLHVYSGETVNLHGGTLETGSIVVEDRNFQDEWSSGTLRVTNSSLTIGEEIGPFDNVLSLGSSQRLEVTGGSLTIGREEILTEPDGDIVVSGAADLFVSGGTVEVAGEIGVGVEDGAASDLFVTNGGQVFSQSGRLGESGISGDAEIIGNSSLWDVANHLFVNADGDLVARSGGEVAIGGTLFVNSSGDVVVGGTISGTPSGSGNLTTSHISVSGSGEFSFLFGTVRDTNSLTLSPTDGLEDLRLLTPGKTLVVDNTTTLNDVTLQLQGGTFETSSLNPSTGALLWFGGTVNLTGGTSNTNFAVPALGQLNATGVINGTVTSGPVSTVTATGHLDVDNLILSGALNVGSNTVSVSGATQFTLGSNVTVGSGGHLDAPNGIALDGTMNVAGAVSGRIAASQSSVINAQGDVTLGDGSLNGFFTNGELNVGQHTVTLSDANDAVFDSGAFVTLGDGGNDGRLLAANGLTLDFGGNIGGFGTIDTPNSILTPFISNGHIGGDSLLEPVTLLGYVKGVGTLDNVLIAGTHSPGLSPTLQIVGSMAYSPTSMLLMEIGGLTPGSEHDQIMATGGLLFDGELMVELISGFTPSAGDVFQLFDSDQLLGAFATLSLPQLSGGLSWDTSSLYIDGTIQAVVPEPSSLALAGMAIVGCCLLARRRRRTTNISACVLAVFTLTMPNVCRAGIVQVTSASQISGVTIPFDSSTTTAAAQAFPHGVNVFASNSSFFTTGISGGFTGNADAPIGPPRALGLGQNPGPATYYHFSPATGHQIDAIGISATGAFANQSTTFHVLVIDVDSNLLEFDVTMTPTTTGLQGLNEGAVFLGVESTRPITAFRVSQLDDGFGVLDNLKVAVSPVPEPATWIMAGLGLVGASLLKWRRRP